MWFFKKKEDTVESLMKDCNKLYSDFRYAFTLAHYKSYYEFKQIMHVNFNMLKDCLGKENDEKVVKSLLLHFKEQLTFLQEHPFSCTPEELKQFEEKHFPYMEKVHQVLSDNNSLQVIPRKPRM